MGISNNTIIKNTTWIVVSKALQSLIALIIGTISARYLGPSNYGLINYASSLVAFVLPISQLGLRNILVEQIVSHPEREGKTIGTALVMSMIASLFCIAGCIAFASIANAGERDTVKVCTLYSISLIFQMSEMIEYWYQAKLLSKYTSLVSLAAYTIVAGYRTYLLVTQKSIYWFAMTNTMDYFLISIALFVLYRKLGNQKLSFSVSLAKKLFAVSRYYIVSGMMVTIFSQTDKIMIKMLVNNAENGYYSTAVTCAGLTSFVFAAMIDSMRPVIFEGKKNDQDLFNKNMTRLYSFVIYMALGQSVIVTLLARPIVLILYGDAYIASASILRLVTWYSAFSYMGSVRNIWVLANGKQRYLWIINLTGALLNIVGNFALIPVFGAEGAACASVITQFFTNYVLCLIMKPIRPTARLIWKAMNPNVLFELLPRKEKKNEM